MVKVPPPARVPPIWASPLVKAPVVKLRDPRFDPSIPPTLIKVEPVRDSPLEFPEITPPAFAMSILLSANAANGTARASTASNAILLTILTASWEGTEQKLTIQVAS
jgi:hypothetical protein